jgi:hypothetical protein
MRGTNASDTGPKSVCWPKFGSVKAKSFVTSLSSKCRQAWARESSATASWSRDERAWWAIGHVALDPNGPECTCGGGGALAIRALEKMTHAIGRQMRMLIAGVALEEIVLVGERLRGTVALVFEKHFGPSGYTSPPVRSRSGGRVLVRARS